MATFTASRLAGPTSLLTTDTLTVSGVTAVLTKVPKQFVFTNITGSSHTVDVNLVPSGGAVAPANKIISNLSIGANSTVIFSIDLPMASGDTITAKASSASSINLTITGIEIS